MKEQPQIAIDLRDGRSISGVEEGLHESAVCLFPQGIDGARQAKITDGGSGISCSGGMLGEQIQSGEIALLPGAAFGERPLLGAVFEQRSLAEGDRPLQGRRVVYSGALSPLPVVL